MLRKMIGILMAAVMCFCILPTGSFALSNAWEEPGNSDLNIRNGGIMLTSGDDFYFVDGGIFVKSGEALRALSADEGKNLNLCDGYIYYTLGSEIRRVPKQGGKTETVFSAATDIDEMYVLGGNLLYLSDGRVYEKPKNESSSTIISTPSDVKGLIPTQYGNLYITGENFDYTVWAKDSAVLSGVSSCYTDSGYLALQIDNQNYMAELESLFNGFDKAEDLLAFDIHGGVALLQLFDADDENTVSDFNDNNELQCDFAALLREAGLSSDSVSLMEEQVSDVTTTTPQVSDGQKNIVKRARQLTEIKWTPLEDITQWGYYGVFKAETTYTGVPYGQPVNCNGYIGYGTSLEAFASAILDNTSKFYTTYSSYNKVAPSLSTDCSGYVSYAWGLKDRKTTYSLTDVAENVGDQSLYSLQIGDCLDKTSSHVVLISNLSYDSAGSVVGVEVMEQTPVITRVTQYGEGASRSLASFQSYYLNNGYTIYRNPNRDSVTYTASAAVPLDGETVAGAKEAAPKSSTKSFVGGKSVTLTSDTAGAVIYYTLDGSAPTAGSTPYTSAITVYNTTKLRAIAVSGAYPESTILEYTVKVPQVTTPTAAVSSGLYSENVVSSGSKISLSSAIKSATIYYTTNGSEPTTSSAVYSAPLTLTQDTTIKAMAETVGMRRSETAVFTYKIGAVYSISVTAGSGGSISPSGNGSVLAQGTKTYAISASSGYAISDVLVDGVSVGAVSGYTFSNVSANHSLAASFKVNVQIPFTDVSSDAWFYDAVGFAYAKGLFNGTSATNFSPDTTMTRGMFVTVLGRFAGLPSGMGSGIGLVTATGVNIRSAPSTDSEIKGLLSNKNTVVQVLSQSDDWYQIKYAEVTGYIRGDLLKVYSGNYTDLTSGQYYSPYAEWACLTGIANTVAGGTFAAESNITREHMCVLLYNYAVFYGKTLPQDNEKAVFTDDSAINPSAKAAVYALQAAGVINGMGDGSFAPQGTATRAQVAQIFMKFVNAVK